MVLDTLIVWVVPLMLVSFMKFPVSLKLNM